MLSTVVAPRSSNYAAAILVYRFTVIFIVAFLQLKYSLRVFSILSRQLPNSLIIRYVTSLVTASLSDFEISRAGITKVFGS